MKKTSFLFLLISSFYLSPTKSIDNHPLPQLYKKQNNYFLNTLHQFDSHYFVFILSRINQPLNLMIVHFQSIFIGCLSKSEKKIISLILNCPHPCLDRLHLHNNSSLLVKQHLCRTQKSGYSPLSMSIRISLVQRF